VTGISMEFSSPLPGDMERCLEMLRGLRRPGGDGEGAE